MSNGGRLAGPGTRSTCPLVGRERELDLLRDSLQQATHGHGGLVLVSGEAGIGKTSLVQAFAGEVSEQDATILRGYCYDLVTTPPYGLWLELTDRYHPRDHMPKLPEVLKRDTGVGEVPNQMALFEVARDFLRSLTQERPLVIVLEDVHWADQASLDLLRYIARRLDDHATLLIATYRDDEVSREHPLFPLLPALIRESQAVRIELGKLGRSDVQSLVAERWELPAREQERLINYLLIHAEGHPLFTVEVLRTLEQSGLIYNCQGGWHVSDLRSVPLPTLVLQVIERRLTELGDEARYYLEVAATIGQQVALDVWKDVSGMSDEDLLAVLGRAVSLHLVEPSTEDNTVSFVHALTRQALYESILPPQRRLWHRLIAATLASSHDPNPDIIAYHFQQAGDDRALDWLIRAGNRAEAIWALRSASERFDQAQSLMAADPSRTASRGWLLFRLARTLRFTEHERALAFLKEAEQIAVSLDNQPLRIAVVAERGFIHAIQGPTPSTYDLLIAALADYDELSAAEWEAGTTDYLDLFKTNGGPDYSGAERNLTVVMESRRSLIVRVLANLGRLRESLELRQTWGPRWTGPLLSGVRVNALGGWAQSLSAFGQPDEAYVDHRERVQRSIDINNFIVAASDVGDDLFWRHLPYRADDLTEREQLIAEMVHLFQLADEYGNATMPPADAHRHPFQLLDGDWREAQAGAEALLAHVQGQPYWHARARVTLAALALHRGEAKRAWAEIAAVLPGGPASNPGDNLFLESMLIQRVAITLSLVSGESARARDWLEAHDRWLDESGALLGRADGLLLWGQFHRSLGDKDSAVACAERALQQASEPRQPPALIAIHRFLGEVATRTQDFEAAEHHLSQSLELAEACAFRLDRALTLLALAELRAAAGDSSRAEELIEVVGEICAPLQASLTLARAHALSSRLAHKGRKANYPNGLTQREVDVLRLIAAGKSNQMIADELFLSPRTIERHISNIYLKTDIHSKAEAAIYALQHGLA